jgi:hypothetical protein
MLGRRRRQAAELTLFAERANMLDAALIRANAPWDPAEQKHETHLSRWPHAVSDLVSEFLAPLMIETSHGTLSIQDMTEPDDEHVTVRVEYNLLNPIPDDWLLMQCGQASINAMCFDDCEGHGAWNHFLRMSADVVNPSTDLATPNAFIEARRHSPVFTSFEEAQVYPASAVAFANFVRGVSDRMNAGRLPPPVTLRFADSPGSFTVTLLDRAETLMGECRGIPGIPDSKQQYHCYEPGLRTMFLIRPYRLPRDTDDDEEDVQALIPLVEPVDEKMEDWAWGEEVDAPTIIFGPDRRMLLTPESADAVRVLSSLLSIDYESDEWEDDDGNPGGRRVDMRVDARAPQVEPLALAYLRNPSLQLFEQWEAAMNEDV